MTLPTKSAMVRRLLSQYRNLSPEQLAAGRCWYPLAQRTARQLAQGSGVSPSVAAGVIAALSPRIQWRQNVDAAATLLADPAIGGSPAFHRNRRAARAIIESGDPGAILKGPKVSAFWRAIDGAVDSVTVDRWAYSAATGGQYPRGGLTPARVRAIQEAYTAAAAAAGETPRDFQAQLWIGARGRIA